MVQPRPVARIITALLDPTVMGCRPAASKEELNHSIKNSGFAYDNLSLIKWMSDTLCRIATAAGFDKIEPTRWRRFQRIFSVRSDQWAED